MFRVKIGESLCPEASAPSKKAARQLAAEEAVKELTSDGRMQLNKVNRERKEGRRDVRMNVKKWITDKARSRWRTSKFHQFNSLIPSPLTLYTQI